MVGAPQLACQEELLARHAGCGKRDGNHAFIHIPSRRVDVTVANLDRNQQCVEQFIPVGEIGSKAKTWDAGLVLSSVSSICIWRRNTGMTNTGRAGSLMPNQLAAPANAAALTAVALPNAIATDIRADFAGRYNTLSVL